MAVQLIIFSIWYPFNSALIPRMLNYLYRVKQRKPESSLLSSDCLIPMTFGCKFAVTVKFFIQGNVDYRKENQLKQKQKEEEERAKAVRRVLVVNLFC